LAHGPEGFAKLESAPGDFASAPLLLHPTSSTPRNLSQTAATQCRARNSTAAPPSTRPLLLRSSTLRSKTVTLVSSLSDNHPQCKQPSHDRHHPRRPGAQKTVAIQACSLARQTKSRERGHLQPQQRVHEYCCRANQAEGREATAEAEGEREGEASRASGQKAPEGVQRP
jgi:hypothetical protein